MSDDQPQQEPIVLDLPEGEPVPFQHLVSLLQDVARQASIPHVSDSPFAKALDERTRHPKQGDLIVEVTTFRDDPEGIGFFVQRRWDMNHPDREQQHPDNHLWEVQNLLTGKRQNWGNAEFRAVATRKLVAEVRASLTG